MPSTAPSRQPYNIGAHFQRGLVWFRRDLRHFDHAALHYALRHCREVYCVFVFDRDILDALLARYAAAVDAAGEKLVRWDAAVRNMWGDGL